MFLRNNMIYLFSVLCLCILLNGENSKIQSQNNNEQLSKENTANHNTLASFVDLIH